MKKKNVKMMNVNMTGRFSQGTPPKITIFDFHKMKKGKEKEKEKGAMKWKENKD